MPAKSTTKLEEVGIKGLIEGANKNVPDNDVKVRIFEAAEKQIPRYRRATLEKVMPPEYWARISWVKEPDALGNPYLEYHAAHMVYSTVSFLRDALNDEHPFLKEAETTERAFLTMFYQRMSNGANATLRARGESNDD